MHVFVSLMRIYLFSFYKRLKFLDADSLNTRSPSNGRSEDYHHIFRLFSLRESHLTRWSGRGHTSVATSRTDQRLSSPRTPYSSPEYPDCSDDSVCNSGDCTGHLPRTDTRQTTQAQPKYDIFNCESF